MKALLLAGVVALPVPSLANASIQVTPPPPPIFTEHKQGARRQLLAWIPGEARCTGQGVAAVTIHRPMTTLGFSQQTKRKSYHFRIDVQGRPLSIVQDEAPNWLSADDVEASLAASRFMAGSARSDCTIDYVMHATPIDAASAGELMAYSVSPMSGRLSSAAWKRMAPAGSTCLDMPRPAPLNRAFPHFDALPATPGSRDWSMVGYDLDAKGRPVKPSIVGSTGSRALDAASIKAVRESRFTSGARSGCLYPYWRSLAPLAAPESPDPASMRPEGSSCIGDRPWAVQPKLVYPAAYRRRAIEGWAVVAYDVAPWGETGNIHVLVSEPAAAFGQQAVQIVRSARKVASSAGATGCVDIVRFAIGMEKHSADEEVSAFVN
jgi:TonB family protein